MYYYIKGKVDFVGDAFAVIEAGGVGYKIITGATTIQRLDGVTDEVKLYTYFNVREDVHELYGFLTEEEMSMFKNLISVSGVGPKAAVSILSAATPEELAVAIISGNSRVITKAQGVGAKLAQRVILELSDKMKKISSEELLASSKPQSMGFSDEAVAALMVLGYSQAESKKAVFKAGDADDLEELIRRALNILMK